MSELKPCPFCGAAPYFLMDPIRLQDEYTFYVHWTIKCPKCHIKQFGVSIYEVTPEEAINTLEDGRKKLISSWNMRYEPDAGIDFDFEAEDDA